jgi:hypothetical protein
VRVVTTVAFLSLVAGCPTIEDDLNFPVGVPTAGAKPTALLADDFNVPDGLITNEYAFYNPKHADAVTSPLWDVTSGSLFARAGTGWSGVPDGRSPDALSAQSNDSAVFRMVTHRADFGDVSVSFRLKNNGLASTSRTPEQSYDGVHISLRHASQFQTYYLSVNRRDDKIIIKKKVAGGPSNGGTYYELTPAVDRPFAYGEWQAFSATVRTEPDGAVTLELFADGKRILGAVDDGSLGGPPLTAPGQVGIRADNCDFQIDDFVVTAAP